MSRTKLDPALRWEILDLAQHRTDPKKYQCARCRRYFARTAVEIDHIVPEADSTPEQRSDPDNLQVLCNPKGSTRTTSCHKAKTAREAADRARRNRIPRRYALPIMTGSCAVLTGMYGWIDMIEANPVLAGQWLKVGGSLIGASFFTGMVENGWRRRRPRRIISGPAIQPEEPGGLDVQRIVDAAREVMGPKGDINVQASGLDAFALKYAGTGFADRDSDARYDLLNQIQTKIGDRWLPIWNTQNDSVRFTRRPTLERMVPHPGFDKKRPWHKIPIAPGAMLDLKVTPHVLIIGTTGAGKTALMRTAIAGVIDSAARDDSTRLILADPKQIEMPGFANWPGVKEIVWETEDLWDMAFDIEREMNERAALIRLKKVKPSAFQKIIVVIDEYEQFFKRMDRHWKTALDKDGKPLKKGGARVPPPIDAIQSVLSMARRMNIHLIIGTQSPDASWFGGTGTRENMSGRIAVGPVDAVRARMMFDDSSIGRDIPIEFKGRGTIQIGDGDSAEHQFYYTPDPFDPDEENSEDDWATLLRLGMPVDQLPDEFKELTT